ncbi:MAG: DUF4386 domain-containing protein [Bacillota bacterium]|nr:DUF4386 domain-containing protein [Bacillota bacterium]
MDNAYRKNSIIVGILFLMGFLGVPSKSLLDSILKSPDYLSKIAANQTQIITGVLLLVIMAVACASIAIWLYPVLKKHNEVLAIGAVSFRLLEAALFFVAAISILAMIPLSHEYINGAASNLKNIGTVLLSIRDTTTNILALLAWNIGAFMYYYVFFRTRLVPRWLSVWGLAGVTLCMVSCILVLYGTIQPFSDIQVAINAPIGLQELVLAVWLIVKGYNTSVLQGKESSGEKGIVKEG